MRPNIDLTSDFASEVLPLMLGLCYLYVTSCKET